MNVMQQRCTISLGHSEWHSGSPSGAPFFQNRLKERLAAAGLDVTIGTNADQYVAVLATMTDQALRKKIVAAYAASFRNTFEPALALTVLGALNSLLIKKSVFARKHVWKKDRQVVRKAATATPKLCENASHFMMTVWTFFL